MNFSNKPVVVRGVFVLRLFPRTAGAPRHFLPGDGGACRPKTEDKEGIVTTIYLRGKLFRDPFDEPEHEDSYDPDYYCEDDEIIDLNEESE